MFSKVLTVQLYSGLGNEKKRKKLLLTILLMY